MECTFCQKFGSADSDAGEWFDEALWGSKDLVLTPALGAFMPGYLLLTVRAHHRSLADVPEELLATIDDRLRGIATQLEQTYGPLVAFEHGPGGGRGGGACITHAHVHLVPYSDDLAQLVEGDLAVVDLGSLEQLRAFAGSSYLLLRSASGQWSVSEDPPIPSQYVRRLLARSIGIDDEWDYLTFPFEANISATLDQLRGAIQ